MQKLDFLHDDSKLSEAMNPKKIAWQMKNKLEDGDDSNNSTIFTLPDRFSLQISEIKDPLDIEANNEERSLDYENKEDYFKSVIEEQAMEIKKLKRRLKSEGNHLTGDLASDAAAAKIVELSRKIRDLTAELEKEKTRTKQLKLRVSELEAQHSDAPEHLKNAEPRQQDKQNDDAQQTENKKEVTALQEKLQHSNTKLAECRNLCQALKKELKIAHKLLHQEIGDETKFQAALNGAGWKGRAQHILTLQNKLAEMKTQLAQQNGSKATNNQLTSSSFSNLSNESIHLSPPTYDRKHREQIKKIEKENREEKQKVITELETLKTSYNETKQKLEASKARNNVLVNEIRTLKSKMSSVIAKGEHDDEFIKILTDKIYTLQQAFLEMNKNNANSSSTSSDSEDCQLKEQRERDAERLRVMLKEREDQLRFFKGEIDFLQKQVDDNFINNMTQQERSESVTNGITSPNSAPVLRRIQRPADLFQIARRQIRSSDPVMDIMTNDTTPVIQANEEKKRGNEYNEFKAMCQEYRIVAQATQVEKEKLLELVSLLNKRLDEAQMKCLQTEQHLQSVQQANVQLEKEVGKANLLGRKSTSTQRLSSRGMALDGCRGDHDSIETNDGSLRSLREENNLLKTALENIMHSKEEDVKIYQEIIEQTRKIFMDGLRQFSEEQT